MTEQRYSDPEIEKILSKQATANIYCEILDALRVASGREPLGLKFGNADMQEWEQAERETGHDIAAFLQVLRSQYPGHSIGAGLTSSNLVDTALVIQIRQISSLLIRRVITETFAHIAVAVPGASQGRILLRTHGQPAAIGTMDQITAAWVERLHQAVSRLESAEPIEISLGGPVGDYSTGISRAMARRVARTLPYDYLILTRGPEQAIARGPINAWLQAVAGLVTECAHIATQIRLRARDGEWREPTGVTAYKGSSSMPFKHNPTRSERICGVERVIRALVGAHSESVVWWDQRDISASSVERIVIPQVAHYAAYVLRELTQILQGLELMTDVITANVVAFEDQSGLAMELASRITAGEDPEIVYREIQARSANS